MSAITFICYNIQYDTDDTDDVPTTLPATVKCIIRDDAFETKEELETILSDSISDQTGFCHNGFKYKRTN